MMSHLPLLVNHINLVQCLVPMNILNNAASYWKLLLFQQQSILPMYHCRPVVLLYGRLCGHMVTSESDAHLSALPTYIRSSCAFKIEMQDPMHQQNHIFLVTFGTFMSF